MGGCYKSPLAEGALEEDIPFPLTCSSCYFPKGIFLFVVARLSSLSSPSIGTGVGVGSRAGPSICLPYLNVMALTFFGFYTIEKAIYLNFATAPS